MSLVAVIDVRDAAMSVSVRMGSNLWFTWARIAIRQERRAMAARAEGLRRQRADEDRGHKMGLETEETIQSVAAVRHAFHNLWRAWKPLLNLPGEKSLRASDLTTRLPANIRLWETQVKDVIDWRDHVVHHDMEMAPTVPHPIYPTNVAPLNAKFTVEFATECVDLLMDVFERVFEAPSEQLREWAEQRQHVLQQMKRLRETGEEF